MATKTAFKTGYWRIDPVTGTREWIEQSNQPPILEEEEELVEEERVSPLISSRELFEIDEAARAVQELQPLIEEVEPVVPEAPIFDATELAQLYGVAATSFMTPKQLAAMALPPEERVVEAGVPAVQYLTWEQARWLGFDVPEGGVVRVTTMAEGDPEFALMPEPGAEVLEVPSDEELISHLRLPFARMFDPANSWGFSIDEIPGMVVDSLRLRMAEDYEGFINDLYRRVDRQEAETILKLLGITEEGILQTLDFKEQEVRVTTLIGDVFPDFKNLEEFGSLVETDFPLFMETMQTGGGSAEKRRLLEFMGYKPVEINQIFSRQKLVLEVDGARQLLTVDRETKNVFDAAGDYVGTYNNATQQFTKEPPKNVFENMFDWTYYQSRMMWEMGENFMLAVMPELVFRDMSALERAIQGDDWADESDRKNAQLRVDFRYEYAKNKAGYEDWLGKHPDLAPPMRYQEGAFQHPELLKDFGYYIYELASITPFIVSATAITLATGGIGLPAMAGMAAIMLPIEGQGVFEDLINAGAPRDRAAQMAFVAGSIIAGLESAGRIPLLKQVSPLLFGQFKKKVMGEIAKKGMAGAIKKFGRDFTISQFSEVVTEVAQEIVANAAVSVYDENRDILANVPDIAVKTAVATLAPSLFGAGVSVRMVSKSDQTGLTDLAKKAKGWIKDEKGNWYAAIKGEEGFVRIPGEPAFEGDITEGVIKKKGKLVANPENIPAARAFVAELRKNAEKADKQAEAATESKAAKLRQNARQARKDASQIEETIPAIPITEPGQPEAGLQPSMLPAEVPAMEVRPKGKGEIVQISMDDQLKLDRARREEAGEPAESIELSETEARIEGLEETASGSKLQKLYPMWKRIQRRKDQNPALTLKEYRDFTGRDRPPPTSLTPDKKHVFWRDALDSVASEYGFDTTEDLMGGLEQYAEQRTEINSLKIKRDQIKGQIRDWFAGTPLPSLPEPSSAELAAAQGAPGQRVLTPKQVTRTLELFAEYIESVSVIKAFELTRELRREARSIKAENLKARAQELIVVEGVTPEEGVKRAIKETLSGELPIVKTDFVSDLTERMREVLFTKLYEKLKAHPLEMASAHTALVRALDGNPIPSDRPTAPPGGFRSTVWPEGASALDKLKYIFSDQPKVLKAIEKIAAEKKPLEKVVEGVYRDYVEGGRPAIPIDQEMADYLRGLQDIPQGYKTLFEPEFDYPIVSELRDPAQREYAKEKLGLDIQLSEGKLTVEQHKLAVLTAWDKHFPPTPPTKYDTPIDKALKAPPMFNFMEQSMFNRTLKELLMSPLDIGNFLRANKASFDNSYLRQSKLLLSGHPIVAWQAHATAWQSMFSQKHTEAEWELITKDPDFQIYEQIRVDTGHDPLRVPAFAATKGTEQYRTSEEFGFTRQDVERAIPRFTAWLPHVKYSERAFSAGTNKVVWKTWKQKLAWSRRYSEKIASGQVKLKAGEAFDIVQEMTEQQSMLGDLIQRANLKRYSGLAPATNAFFFAARSKIGRFLLPKHLLGMTFREGKVGFNPRVMKEAWKDFFLLQSYMGGLMFLGSWLNLWDLEDDPRNAEFMSARIGKTRIDPWAGYRQFAVLYARLITGTGISSVTGAEYDVNKVGALQSFITNSLSPLASILLEFWTGRNFLGQVIEYDDAKYWIEKVTPFSINDVWEAAEEDWRMGIAVTIPAVYGEGVQTYTGDWEENWTKLGLPKYLENTAYGLNEPYYDTADFWSDTASQFKDVDVTTLTAAKGFPEYIRAIVQAKAFQDHLSTLPTDTLVSLNADPSLDEPTFTEYRKMWADRKKLIAAGDDAEFTVKGELQADGKRKDVTYKGDDAIVAFDKKNPGAENGNFSQAQFALLNEYWAITDEKKQTEFLEEHKDDIGVKPRDEWLRSHTKENAQLAVWGQAKIYTKAAFDEFNRLVKELDIPENALPELTVPPKTSWDTHISYEEMVSEGTATGIGAKLLLLEDHLAAQEAGVQSYVDWRIEQGKPLTLSDKPVAYLQLRVDNAQLYADLEEAQGIAIKADREAAVEAVRSAQVGDETFHDIERRVDAMGKGTREVPIPDEIVQDYVEHMRIVDETSGNSAEAKLNRYDNDDLNDFLMSEDYWGKDPTEALDENKAYLDNYLVPRWRIDVEYSEEDAEFKEIPGDDAQARAAYLAGEGLNGAALARRVEYRYAKRRHEALSMTNKVTGDRFPLEQVEPFINYWEIPIKGKRQERYLVENGGQDPENLTGFAWAMHNIAGIDIDRPEDVPSVEFDNLSEEWADGITQYDGFSDNESRFYIEFPEPGLTLDQTRQKARDAMMFTVISQTYSGVKVKNNQLTAFGLAHYKRQAYENFVPEEFVNDYVAYYKIYSEGKPPDWALQSGQSGQGLWLEDDWFMLEHMEFYENVYRDLLGNGKWDFTKVPMTKEGMPDREVFEKYLTYIALPHTQAQKEYRWNNKDLDAWGVIAFGWKPIEEQKRRKGLTTYERFIEKWAERGEEIEERLKALRE